MEGGLQGEGLPLGSSHTRILVRGGAEKVTGEEARPRGGQFRSMAGRLELHSCSTAGKQKRWQIESRMQISGWRERKKG